MYLFSKYLLGNLKAESFGPSIPRVFAKSNKLLNNINNNKLDFTMLVVDVEIIWKRQLSLSDNIDL